MSQNVPKRCFTVFYFVKLQGAKCKSVYIEMLYIEVYTLSLRY